MRPYDSTLVDFDSPSFQVGMAEGKARRARLEAPANPATSEVDWASYCEGWLMGSCEPEA